MRVVVDFGGSLAIVEDRRWDSDDKQLAKRLNTEIPTEDIGPEYPNPDLTIAERAIDLLGGTVIFQDDPPEHLPDRIY
ncbi:hypothetical protein LCGC14_0429140 [marine sediment metagenome]|uniref:Uncharacterized protein n=1 Tax=marine sediment metagenome TaxID=412755 RepID=A0A0F9VAQ5_9ZZZZ